MRITHVSLRYPPASGGVEDYAQQLVERLRASGDDVAVHTTALRTHHPATFLEVPLDDPPYVRRHPVRTLGPIAYPIPQGLHYSLLTTHYSLIHAHGFWYAPADIAARVARARKIPFVLNPYFAPRRKWFWRAYRALRGNRTMSAADALVVISPQEEAELRAAGFAPRRVELVPPGIDPSEFSPRRENPFVARGIRSPHVLFFAGRIAHAKGLDLLLRALPTLLNAGKDPHAQRPPFYRNTYYGKIGAPMVHLAIAGEDFGERASFERLAVRLGVSRFVTWLGKLPRAELLAAYQHAAVFVFPSRYEAFGITPLEAQAAGCPVVAMDTASLPYVVQHETTGLLCRPEDSDAIAANVLRLLRDRDLAHRYGAAGRERALRDFPWEKSITKLRALYASLVCPAQNNR